MSVTPFEVGQETLEGGIELVSVLGELDLDTAPQLEAVIAPLKERADTRLLLDLGGCDFIDSTGVALVVRTWQGLDREAEQGGEGKVVLCCAGPQVCRVIEITGLQDSIAIHEDREEAEAVLRSARG